MRRVLSLAFVAVLMLNLFGFYAAFILNLSEARKEMEESLAHLEKEDLSFMSMSHVEFENITWVKRNKEFRLNNRLFDVEEIKIYKDQVLLYVEEDTKEADLIERFASLFFQQQEGDNSQSPTRTMLYDVIKEFIAHPDSFKYFASAFLYSFYSAETFLYSSFIVNPLSPPPDRVS
ncbi:MAG: hypothetical protein IPP77_14040 [Bacteroidetes bacterium]|nr:hypothetical protein [Bacteroidota bacterium]